MDFNPMNYSNHKRIICFNKLKINFYLLKTLKKNFILKNKIMKEKNIYKKFLKNKKNHYLK